MTEADTAQLRTCSDGATVTVTVRNDGGELVVESEADARVAFAEAPSVPESQTRSVRATVVKTVTGHRESADMVVLRPTAVHESGPERGRTRTDADEPGSRTRSSDDSGQRGSAGDPDGDSSPCSLDDIAAELIGDRELAVTGEERSAVAEAKDRARDQGRDPAIDPKLDDV
ncbi:hypothetical protein [Halosimplex halobium]|uniref:hypothetical protein n=1 Tax=Halosimplex halobium TaxID=3396618 RepID=UPI003F543418